MIAFNESSCSPQFIAAFRALEGARDVRRAEWPDGMFLRMIGDRIAVFRNGIQSAPYWMPSSAETSANDWLEANLEAN